MTWWEKITRIGWIIVILVSFIYWLIMVTSDMKLFVEILKNIYMYIVEVDICMYTQI